MYLPFETFETAPRRTSISVRQIVAPACAMALALLGTGCATKYVPRVPPGVTTLKAVETKRLEGTWYEIARLNHRAERGLTRATVTFKSLPMNKWQVVHRAWRNESGAWEETAFRAKSPEGVLHPGTMRGRFTSLFPSDIHVVAMDKTYQSAIICGTNQHELWILSRAQNPSHESILGMLNEARSKGFPIEEALFLQFQ
ncbi:MAG: lipocalin family protein [Verrucomicrobiota bacterium]